MTRRRTIPSPARRPWCGLMNRTSVLGALLALGSFGLLATSACETGTCNERGTCAVGERCYARGECASGACVRNGLDDDGPFGARASSCADAPCPDGLVRSHVDGVAVCDAPCSPELTFASPLYDDPSWAFCEGGAVFACDELPEHPDADCESCVDDAQCPASQPLCILGADAERGFCRKHCADDLDCPGSQVCVESEYAYRTYCAP